MKLIVGLGNPGAKYVRNRHNVGFMAADRIVERHGLGPWRRRFQAETAEGAIDGVRCLVLKPQTFMNESGRAVGEAARFLKIEAADVVVLHDELDIAPGRLKVKTGGGNAGHNGLKSISTHLGNEYVRVRIGIGHPGHKDAVHGYVLHDFAQADATWLDPLLAAIADAGGLLVRGEAQRFMSEVARLASGEAAVPAAGAANGEGRRPAKAVEPAQAQAPAIDRGESKPPARPGGAFAEKLGRWLKGRGA